MLQYCAAVLLSLAVFTIAHDLWAQRSPAAQHLNLARAAKKHHDWATGLSEYSAAEAAEDSVEALEGIADAQYHLGHDGEAYDAYEALLRRLASAKPGRKGFGAIDREAGDRLRELSGRTGTLAVSVEDHDATVFVDDRALGDAPLSRVIHVGAGSHRVHAEIPNGPKAEQRVEVAAGGSATVQLRVQLPEPKPAPPTPAADSEASDAGAADAAQDGAQGGPPGPHHDVWDVPHGSVRYKAVLTKAPPRIDGNLDDPIWKEAPADSHFFSINSKPYGQPTTEPTSVQVAYDDEYLYVAFRCGYSSARPRDDSFPTDEVGAIGAENVGIYIDPLHDHTNALVFTVTRVGARADVELTQSGQGASEDWRGVWDAQTRHTADWWTAEYRIPWGTLRIPAQDNPLAIGIQFRRVEPIVGEYSIWSLEPREAPGYRDPNYFGHLEGLEHIRPRLRLYVQPYAAIAFDQQAGTFRSRLSDFAGTQSSFRTYAGLYARYYPPGPLRIEATANPDFSTAPPDQAVANFDRFELVYPEVRPFFAEDNPRFAFGLDGTAQLFYSRRIGLITDPRTGATTTVPVLYGGKAILRSSGTEVAAMNVGLSTPNPAVTLADNVGVLRFNQLLPSGAHIGTIVMGRTGSNGSYGAAGIDGAVAIYDRHLILSGFLARTATQGQPASGMGEAQVAWTNEDFYARTSYLDVGTALDAQLGFVPVTGIRSNVFATGYTPVLRTDLVEQLRIEGSLSLARDRGDVRVYDRGVVSGSAELINGGYVQVQALPAIENVLQAFPLFAGRLTVPAGQYDVMALQTNISTAPRKPIVVGVGYLTGDLFGGQRQSPSIDLGFNLNRFSSDALYELFLVRYGAQEFVGHQLSATAGYSYTPLARTTLVLQANTLIERAVAQLVTSYTFGLLSTISLILVKTTGASAFPADQWLNSSKFSAILSFAYGISPF